MRRPYHKFLGELRQLTSSFSISYLRKWLPAAILVGIAAGVACIAFSLAITWATKLFLGLGAGFVPPVPVSEGETIVTTIGKKWMIPAITVIGGLISGFIVCRFAPEIEGGGADAAIGAFHRKEGIIRPRVPLLKMIASAITIGSGGSAGREGPIAQITAGCGSLVGRLFRFSAHDRRLATAVGIGAGIGSIFKAPLGGAILSAEILYLQGFESEALIPSFISTAIGYSIFASWQGFTPIFGEHLNLIFHGAQTLPSYAILGIACGLVAILYTRIFHGVHNLFHRLKFPNYYKPAIGGLVVGLIGLALPQVLCIGYGWLQLAMQPGKLTLTILVALVFAKIVATSFSVGSGGSGGLFAPSLVIGGMLAASLWTIGHNSMGTYLPSSPEPFVVVGMMALLGAASHIPLATIIMVSEMSGTYTMLAPAMIAVGLAYVIVGRNSIEESQISSPAASPAHKYEYVSPLLRTMRVKQAMVSNFKCLSPKASIEEAAEVIQSYKMDTPVTNTAGKLVGIIANEDILPIPQELRRATKVKSVMSTNLVMIHSEETLERALETIVTKEVAILPVVDKKDPTKLLGLVTRNSIIQAYESEAKKMLGDSMNSG
jgi:CIC family chloride channel protein